MLGGLNETQKAGVRAPAFFAFGADRFSPSRKIPTGH